jgi:hypothetical protein
MDYKLLNAGEAISLVTGVQVTKWGSEVTVSCLYDPRNLSRPYQLKYIHCHKVRWEVVFPDEDIEEGDAALIGFTIGEKFYKKSAIIATDVFELTIEYGDFVVLKEW